VFTACGMNLPAGDQDEVELQFNLILVTSLDIFMGREDPIKFDIFLVF